MSVKSFKFKVFILVYQSEASMQPNEEEPNIKRILGERLLISSLPGEALRTLVDIVRLAERFNMRSQSRAW